MYHRCTTDKKYARTCLFLRTEIKFRNEWKYQERSKMRYSSNHNKFGVQQHQHENTGCHREAFRTKKH